MTINNSLTFKSAAKHYLSSLQDSFNDNLIDLIENLAKELLFAWQEGRQVFICGNGGSAANALHIANDMHYGIGACGPGPKLPGIKVEALSANTGVITCLANDTGYENIYSHQLSVKANADDILLVLSGSGNSKNIIQALEKANELKLRSFAIIAYDGGQCLHLADYPIHFQVNDMQIAEDTQLLVGHICMQWLNKNKPQNIGGLI